MAVGRKSATFRDIVGKRCGELDRKISKTIFHTVACLKKVFPMKYD